MKNGVDLSERGEHFAGIAKEALTRLAEETETMNELQLFRSFLEAVTFSQSCRDLCRRLGGDKSDQTEWVE